MMTILFVLLIAGLAALLTCASASSWKRVKYQFGKAVLMANAVNAPNAGRSLTGVKSYIADAAVTRFHLVKLTGVGTCAVSAAATDKVLGIAQDQAEAAGDPIAVSVLGAATGTQLVVATGVIAIDAFVSSNGDGTVKTAVATNYVIGKALQASQATGDIIEITPIVSSAVVA